MVMVTPYTSPLEACPEPPQINYTITINTYCNIPYGKGPTHSSLHKHINRTLMHSQSIFWPTKKPLRHLLVGMENSTGVLITIIPTHINIYQSHFIILSWGISPKIHITNIIIHNDIKTTTSRKLPDRTSSKWDYLMSSINHSSIKTVIGTTDITQTKQSVICNLWICFLISAGIPDKYIGNFWKIRII